MYNTIGQQSAQLANKLFNTINRRHELKAQGKLAELQANLSREERQFGAETQRLRDRDYQKFQKRMREDQQLHQKTERIARQTHSSVESGKQRAFTQDMQRTGAELQLLHQQYGAQLQDYLSQREAARTKQEREKYNQLAYDVYNEMNQTIYGGTKGDSRIKRHFDKVSADPRSWWRLMPAVIGHTAGMQMLGESGQVEPEQFQWSKKAFKNLIFDKAQQHGVDPMQAMEIVGSTPQLLENPQWRGALGMPTEFAPGQTGYGKGDPLGRINMALQQATSDPQPIQPGAQIPVNMYPQSGVFQGQATQTNMGGNRMRWNYPSLNALTDDYRQQVSKVYR